ncbi:MULTISPECIES: membrane protein insertase YidC [Duncaniella]|uniref:membrane protein insertase YidC n=1 Tax=Duncaniella TaxID=2518495 RepID=UPI000E8EDACB|nr:MULTISPECIES: membrane protein insertase YidC [Duncaniella]MBJ2191055.1 membrane protein insertase YidC [Muribaculaceae bacterium]MCX4284513.1 membrane protein insertase YidC [Duncaniella dubosii]HBN63827.1 membrane protein insertase YidC [Porphyromonadaceae bacterium]
MDRNSIIGLLLMGLIIFGFTYINRPSAEELERQRIEREQMQAQEAEKATDSGALKFDSITPAEIATIKSTVRELGVTDSLTGVSTLRVDKVDLRLSADGDLQGTVDADGRVVPVADIIGNSASLPVTVGVPATKNLRNALATVARYRGFARHISGDSTTVKLENKLLSLELSNKGGVISCATLKNYDSYDSTKVKLLSPETDTYSFTLTSATQRFETREFYFTPVQLSDSSVLMKLDLGDGAVWGIKYTLPEDSYLVDIDIVQQGMQSIIPSSVASMDFTWHQKMRRNEAGRVFEERNSALYYMFIDGDVDNLSESGDDKEEINQRLKWVSCKNQFFSAVLMARTNFNGGELSSVELKDNPDFIKEMQADMSVEYSASVANPASFVMYLGPNSYPVMSSLEKEIFPDENMHLTKLIPLGWPLFRWINTLIIIPVFTALGSFISNYGIIILLLTIFIKLILFPFTYKSMMSQARMRLLAPEIKAINDKYPGNENAMKRQQETMALYSRAGANPLSGCLPMLLQMPILVAMFWFFPSAIELRGESFLWAKDLSAPDAIISWTGNIPFISSTFGNHVSLFCLLMTVTNIIYTRVTMQTQNSAGMPGMKWMMYLMPVMFLFIFNNYAAGLSYYYFLSLLITIVQTYIFRKVVSEEKMRAKMAEAARKPKKKSGFMARLEEAQRKQQQMLREQQKRQGRR